MKKPIFDSLVEVIENDQKNAEILITPVEKNFGNTLGHLLRRNILGMTPGCSITSIYINNDQKVHDFSSITGIEEDMDKFISSLKQAQISMDHYGPRFLFLKKEGPCVVTLGDITCPSDIQISNPELYLCTIHQDTVLDVKMTVESGVGFKSNKGLTRENEVKIHTIFSPVTNVSYHVKHFTFYEELILHVQTDGTVPPIDLINYHFRSLCTKFTSLS